MKLVTTQHFFPHVTLTSANTAIQPSQHLTTQSKQIEKGNLGLAK